MPAAYFPMQNIFRIAGTIRFIFKENLIHAIIIFSTLHQESRIKTTLPQNSV